MKKSLKICVVIAILSVMLLPITSYAIDKINQGGEGKSFFKIAQSEVSKNEKVEMVIDLEKVSYNKFEFTLESSANMENVEVNQNINVEKSGNDIKMEIDKSKTNVSQITLYYTISEAVQVNDVIKFTAKITNIDSGKEDVSVEGNNEAGDSEVESGEISNKTESQTVQAQVKVVEKKEQQGQDREENNNQQPSQSQGGNKEQNKGQESQNTTGNGQNANGGQGNKEQSGMQSGKEQTGMPSQNAGGNQMNGGQMNGNQSSNTAASGQMMQSGSQSGNATTMGASAVSGTNTVTYNGSDNNYLKKLSVKGYELNKDFSKDNSTYFITVENDASSLDITATVEESSSTICVYGNEDLKEGTNKVLISVTAENGNVRNYRIYVTKNA